MKDQSPEEILRHFRFGKSAITICVKPFSHTVFSKGTKGYQTVRYGVAYCSPKDQFCYKKGATLARERADNVEQVSSAVVMDCQVGGSIIVNKSEIINTKVCFRVLVSLLFNNKIPKSIERNIDCAVFSREGTDYYYR